MDTLCGVSLGLLLTIKIFFIHKLLVFAFNRIETLVKTKSIQCDENSQFWFPHTLSKAAINIAACTGMLVMVIYILTLDEVVKNPYSISRDFKCIDTALNFLVAYNLFNLLEATPKSERLQWSLTSYFTSIILVTVSIVVLVRHELAILAVVCLFMSGSSLADDVLLIVRLFTPDDINSSWVTRAYIFCISNHLIFNCICPVGVLLVTTFVSNENVLEMSTSTIATFFTVMILLIISNCWRLLKLMSEFCLRRDEVERNVINGSNSDSGYSLSVSSEEITRRYVENNDYV